MWYQSFQGQHGIRGAIQRCAMGLMLWGCSSSSGDAVDYRCQQPPADLAACSVDADCTTVAEGCYCGAQPVNGVARTYAAPAQACADTAASTCALGCAIELRLLAQDGQKVDPGTAIAVRCDHAGGAAGTCMSYVP